MNFFLKKQLWFFTKEKTAQEIYIYNPFKEFHRAILYIYKLLIHNRISNPKHFPYLT